MSDQAKVEKIKFKIEVYSTYWNKPPVLKLQLNDKTFYNDTVKSGIKDPTMIQFEASLKEGEKYNLSLHRSNKDNKQCVVENGNIVKDQLLHIKSIEIDEIDIGSLIYNGVYTPEYPEPWYSQQVAEGNTPEKSYKNVSAMGHNGTWTLAFESPFYMWLLENLY